MISPTAFLARLTRLSAMLVVSFVAACGSNGNSRLEGNVSDSASAAIVPDTSYGAAALVARSEWCLQHGCVAQPLITMDSGVVNHPFRLPGTEQAAVEAQTRDTLLIGAGLMLWKGRHAEGLQTQGSLVSFARGIVGDCPTGLKHVETQYNAAASAVMTTPLVRCGRWAVRTGQFPTGFFVSVDVMR